MRGILQTATFKRDLKRALRRGKDPAKLQAIVECLALGQPLAPRHRPHPLSGDWQPNWECHIESDWLLVYEVSDDSVQLVRTGTHSDLFE